MLGHLLVLSPLALLKSSRERNVTMRACALFFLVAMLPATASFSLGVAPATGRVVAASQSQPAAVLRVTPMMVEAKEDGEDKENMMQQVKDAGVAGIISYVFWEWAFWGVSGK